MKARLYSLLLSVVITIGCIIPAQKLRAQMVLIPDSNFVVWLKHNGYSACMTGNLMDTTCSAVVNATDVGCYSVPIYDLTGIQYFKSLISLDCSYDSLNNIPNLPPTLRLLNCAFNLLTSLPELSTTLRSLDCSFNQLTSLPALPASIGNMLCNNNQLTNLPTLPAALYLTFDCSHNQITSLPAIPAGLVDLYCGNNQLTNLPALPPNLSYLGCSHNLLTSLPTLPIGLTHMFCDSNQLTELPALPTMRLNYLYCNDNPNLACLPKLPDLSELDFSNTAVTCLPNYGRIINCNPPLSIIPLCNTGNVNGCSVLWNISGRVYFDLDSNCVFDSSDQGRDIKMNLYYNGVLQQQLYAAWEGYYSFDVNNIYGNYTIEPVISGWLTSIICPFSGVDSAVISATDSFLTDRDFALRYSIALSVPIVVTETLQLSLLPNPAHNYVMIQTAETTTGASLQLSDIQGREILTTKLTSNNYRLETAQLSAGLYLVKVVDLNGRGGVRKLVIE